MKGIESRQILELREKGRNITQIAEEIKIARSTIKSFLKNCGAIIKRHIAKPKPKIKDIKLITLITLILSFSESHFSNLDGSPSP